MIQAAKAAVLAGGAEAWRMRKEPGGWAGPKGRRVLTAAVGAAGINGLVGKDGDKGETIQAVIGGLAGNRLINGSRKDEDSRSRSRSRGRGDRDKGSGGGIAGLGAGALAAAAGKAFMDRAKSKDRGKRDYSSSSDDRRGGGRHRRSKSVSEYMRSGMAALGIGNNEDQRDTIDRGSRRDLGYESDDYPPPPRPRGGDGNRSSRRSSSHNSSSDDDFSSSQDEKERKKLGKKQLLKAGLASVATIHAANNIYHSIHMRQVRAKEVAMGELSPEEARKRKYKGRLQNAGAIGVAALGVKGAYSEWKEIKEHRERAQHFDTRRAERHERRLLKQYEHGQSSTSNSAISHSTRSVSSYGHYHQNGSPYMDAHDQCRSTAPHRMSNPNNYHSEPSSLHYSDGNPFQTTDLPLPSTEHHYH